MSHPLTPLDSSFRTLSINGTTLRFQTADQAPFILSGLPWHAREAKYCRLPQGKLPQVSDGVRTLAWNTSGGQVRFRTDSAAIGIHAVLQSGNDRSHMPRSGSGGFDLYEGHGHHKLFRTNIRHEHGSVRIQGLLVKDPSREMREWTLYFPLYNGIESLYIGFDPGAVIEPPAAFSRPNPVLFYGSSITQGGCASRPGNAYPAIVTRRLDAPLVNWGFSGNARGERVMAEMIAGLDPGVFVFDYDHNAPTPDHLERTHEPFFKIIRNARPRLPVVFVSRPDFYGTDSCCRRRDCIRNTYERARAAGDERVLFVDGAALFGSFERDACTVDGCHPNDIGFRRMADGITPAVQTALDMSA